ncbi:uncharacterized protein K452DRAFT_291970 [Aplosporella prunicola CBS 121167]|uniref:Uncharacterized protein n=1 Tax=Aplosporella prunicola CBS 121167 TaxID=1176127 RepID=A0A6A6B0G4_9PEZI|nr:uncharacterized protein K452DRAFT_291970 [Aplosporella prunicola CBS 121167]KAF2136933.1 hypothetical protein K452DRAFT_291970 [Aplosporella prunicola CBS 121167]
MRTTYALLAACAATAAAPAKSYPAIEELAVRTTDGRNGFTHVQFPIECQRCFRSDPAKPKSKLIDGVLEFDVRITRHLGLDGDDAAQINGYTVEDEELPFVHVGKEESGNINSAIQLYAPTRYDADGAPIAGPYTTNLRGSISFETLVKNGTHDVKGVVFNVTHIEAQDNGPVPAALTGFRLSYSRKPKNTILRIQQNAAPTAADPYPFADREAWIEPPQVQHFLWASKNVEFINKAHDLYPGWNPNLVECKTIACRVNKLHTRFTVAYDACVERLEDPLASGMPLHCRAYLLPYYAKKNIMWVGAGTALLISTVMRMLLQKKKDADLAKKKEAKQLEDLMDRMEDDVCDYLIRTEGVANPDDVPAPAALEAKESTVEARRAYNAEEL